MRDKFIKSSLDKFLAKVNHGNLIINTASKTFYYSLDYNQLSTKQSNHEKIIWGFLIFGVLTRGVQFTMSCKMHFSQCLSKISI